jgi:hypothetical protein
VGGPFAWSRALLRHLHHLLTCPTGFPHSLSHSLVAPLPSHPRPHYHSPGPHPKRPSCAAFPRRRPSPPRPQRPAPPRHGLHLLQAKCMLPDLTQSHSIFNSNKRYICYQTTFLYSILHPLRRCASHCTLSHPTHTTCALNPQRTLKPLSSVGVSMSEYDLSLLADWCASHLSLLADWCASHLSLLADWCASHPSVPTAECYTHQLVIT